MSDEKKVDKEFLKNLIVALDNRNVEEKIIAIMQSNTINNNDGSLCHNDELIQELIQKVSEH